MRRSGGARWCVAALSAMVIGSYAGSAYAGNLDAFYLSGEASMQAGAISADSRGGGAVWYNPAGLAGLDGLRLDVSVNGYAIRFGGAADFDAPPGADVKRLTGLDINVVPTALTITKNFGSVGFGFGVFVPSQATNILRTQVKLNSDAAGGGLFQFSYDTYRRYQEYHIGPALGFRVSDDLQVGASFLINYRSLVEMADTALIYSVADGGSASTASHQLLDSIQAGAEFVIGAQWKFAKNWRWGGVVRTPAVRLYQLVQTLHTDVMDQGLGQSSMSANEVSAIESTVLTPFRFHTGVSHTFGDSRIALEGSLLLPFEDPDAGTQTRLTWNGRVGMRTALSPSLSLGGGLFTDMSALPEPKEFGQGRLNYYGATVAVDMGTPYGVYAKDGKTYPRPRTLLFGTTVALSYALGLGQIVRAAFANDPVTGPTVSQIPTEVTAHEIYLHLGSTLAE